MANQHDQTWTDERCDLLRQRWSEGFSASAIGGELGCSRCAILGKAKRLELTPRRLATSNPTAQKPRRRRPTSVSSRTIKRLSNHGSRFDQVEVNAPEPYVDTSMDDTTIPFEQRKQLLDLTDGDCRWPVGDPGTEVFFFCGGTAVEGLPYCGAHCRRAYNSVRPREIAAGLAVQRRRNLATQIAMSAVDIQGDGLAT
jgi:GcrA cell cycle regulator